MTVTEDHDLDRRSTSGGPVYVYGIVRAASPAPEGTGVTGSAVATVTSGPLAALTSEIAKPALPAKRRDLLRHSEVLQEAYAHGAVLPLRFGTVFASGSAVVDELLDARADELRGLLDRFDGLGELRVRARYTEEAAVLAEIVRSEPGIARLREAAQGRAAQDARMLALGEAVANAFARRRQADADAVVARLAAIASDVRVDEPSEPLEYVKASFLVRREDAARFDELLESVALTQRHLSTFSCTGPMPPHSFVELAGG